MQLQEVTRSQTKIKMALQGPSSSGKTLSALLIAYGLCPNWQQITLIDTENKSAALYAHLGPFQTIDISPPYTPEKYIEALELCKAAQMQVIIVDSLSQLWAGMGGILSIHGAMKGNSFTNWAKVMPRYHACLQAILAVDAYVICTLRTKQAYILTEKEGKQIPEKTGLKTIAKEGTEYEFSLIFELNALHEAKALKDRTGLFVNQSQSLLNKATGELIKHWTTADQNIKHRIQDCKSMAELIDLYQKSPTYQDLYAQFFSERKQQLEAPSP